MTVDLPTFARIVVIRRPIHPWPAAWTKRTAKKNRSQSPQQPTHIHILTQTYTYVPTITLTSNVYCSNIMLEPTIVPSSGWGPFAVPGQLTTRDGWVDRLL